MSHLWRDISFLQLQNKRNKHICCRLKEASEQIHPLCLHPFLSCWYLASHVCYHHIPLSWFTEGWGALTDLSSVHNKRTTGNFAFEGLNMHERPKWVRARGMSLCDPLFNPNIDEQMHPLPQSNRWKYVSNCAWWAPPFSPIALCTEDSWEADIPSSQLSAQNKTVWDPSYTHVHVCPPPQYHHKKKKSQFKYRLIIFLQTFLEDESLGESEKQGLVSAPLKSGLVN